MKQWLYLLVVIISVASCRKKDDPVTAPDVNTGSVKMNFTNVFGNKPLTLGSVWYTTAAGDSVTIITYNYYISNIVLTTVDGKNYSEPESYHLVEQNDPATWHFTISGVPAGDYTSIHFLIGVDSLHNASGAQAGDLSPSRGMIWNWNTGYIMAKMEGRSPSSPNASNLFYYHIAGYKDGESVLKEVTLNFPEAASVTPMGAVPGIHLYSDAAQWFTAPRDIFIRDFNNIQSTGFNAMQMASQYADMFTVDHIDH